MKLPHVSLELFLVEAGDVLEVEKAERGAHLHDLGDDFAFVRLHIDRRETHEVLLARHQKITGFNCFHRILCRLNLHVTI